MAKEIKILLWNAGYFRGIDGNIFNHLRYGYRHFYCSDRIQAKYLEDFKNLIKSENPDICCLVEIDKGSFNNMYVDQMPRLASSEYKFADAEKKASPEFIFRNNPFFVGKSNGFLSKKKYIFRKIYLKNGVKRLVYLIELDGGIKLLLVHLTPFSRRIRKKQIDEIKEIVSDFDKVIICGDFNIFGGSAELDNLLENSELVLMNGIDDKTYPAYSPRRALDLFICSENIAAGAKLSILKDWRISDHLPLILKIGGAFL